MAMEWYDYDGYVCYETVEVTIPDSEVVDEKEPVYA